MKTRYEANDTMRLIGKQGIAQLLDPEIKAAMLEILSAHGAYKNGLCDDTLTELAMDCFQYGYLVGKRAERTK